MYSFISSQSLLCGMRAVTSIVNVKTSQCTLPISITGICAHESLIIHHVASHVQTAL